MKKHLWEVNHPYYCNESNYYSSESPCEYESWGDFYHDWGNSDSDLNLLFRQDWYNPEDSDDKRSRIRLFFMLQRKGKYISCIVKINRKDETHIKRYLETQATKLAEIWMPILLCNKPSKLEKTE